MTAISAKSRAVLTMMLDGRVMVGTLGENPLRKNRRTFRLDDGSEVQEYVARSLIKHGWLKAIATSGEDPPRTIHYMITELGRAMTGEQKGVQSEAHQTPR